MSKLTDYIKDKVIVRHYYDKNTGEQVTRAEFKMVSEHRTMRYVTHEHQANVDDHAIKGLAYHMEDLAYEELRKLLYDLQCEVRTSTSYRYPGDEAILKLRNIIS